VVNSLAEKRDHVPYRQSKLTNFLRDSIGGNSKTIMFANVWPTTGFIEETCSTLRFASRMATIKNEVTINVTQDLTA
jgi:kinesin family protein 6/9